MAGRASRCLQRQPGPNPAFYCAPVHLWRHGHIVERQPQVDRQRPFVVGLPAPFGPCDQFAQVRVRIRRLAKISHAAVVLELSMVVGCDPIHLRQGRRLPVAVKVHRGAKGAGLQPVCCDRRRWML